jgi:hypothetical protein
MAVECCYDPCQQPGMMMGAPTHVFGDGANCCN